MTVDTDMAQLERNNNKYYASTFRNIYRYAFDFFFFETIYFGYIKMRGEKKTI